MNLRVEKKNNYSILFIEGRIDIIVAEELDKEINFVITSGEKNLMIDLEKITYFSSSGVRMLITLKHKAEEAGGKMVLVHINSTVDKIFSTLGLMNKFEIYDDRESAAHSFNS